MRALTLGIPPPPATRRLRAEDVALKGERVWAMWDGPYELGIQPAIGVMAGMGARGVVGCAARSFRVLFAVLESSRVSLALVSSLEGGAGNIVDAHPLWSVDSAANTKRRRHCTQPRRNWCLDSAAAHCARVLAATTQHLNFANAMR